MNVNYYDYVDEEDDDSVEMPEMAYTDSIADNNKNQANLAKTSTEATPVQIVGKENKINIEPKPDIVTPINCELTDLSNKNQQIYPSCFHNKKFSNTDLPSTNPSLFTT